MHKLVLALEIPENPPKNKHAGLTCLCYESATVKKPKWRLRRRLEKVPSFVVTESRDTSTCRQYKRCYSGESDEFYIPSAPQINSLPEDLNTLTILDTGILKTQSRESAKITTSVRRKLNSLKNVRSANS